MKSQLFFEVGIKDVQKSLDEQKRKIKDWANNNPIELKIELQSLKSQLRALGVAFGSNNKQIQGLSKEVDKAMGDVERRVKASAETISQTLTANNVDKLHKRIAEVNKALRAMNNHNLATEANDVFQMLFARRIRILEQYKAALEKASKDPNLGKSGYLQGLTFNGEQLLGSVNKMLVSPGAISSIRKEMDNSLEFRRKLIELEKRYQSSKSLTITNGRNESSLLSKDDTIRANAERLKANVEFMLSTLRELQAVRAKVLSSGGNDADLAKTINEMKIYVSEMQRLGNSAKALSNNKLMDSSNMGIVGQTDALRELIRTYRELYGLASGGSKGKAAAGVIDTKSVNEAVYQVSQLENRLARIKALEAKASDLGIDTTKMRTIIQEMEGYLRKFREVVDNGGKSNGGLTAQMLKSEGEFRSFTARIAENSRELRQNINEKNHAVSAERGLQSAIHSSTSAMRNQSQVLSDLRSMAQQYISVWAAQQFVSNIIEQGGQLEQQRLSIQAILGDAAHAQTLFNQVKDLAIKSPFGVTEIDKMSKQLSAYGFQYSELFDLTKRLADISAATGTEVSRLALALGHVRSEAALSGYTLRQFSMANVPLLTKLTEKLGVSAKEVREMVRKKEIGYDIVLEIMKELTDESGMFYNAQEVMSQALNAKFKNLRDSFQIMYSEMAEGAPGDALKKLAVVLTDMSRNWKTIMPMMASAAGIFTSLKVSTMLLNRGLAVTGGALSYNAIATSKYSMAQLRAIATTGRWRLGLIGLRNALSAVGRFVFNPVNMGFTAVMAAVEGLIYLWQKNNREMEKAAELTSSFSQEGSEGVRNMQERIAAVRTYNKGMTDSELKQGIDSMTQTLRDYGINVGKILNDTFGADASGNVASLADQYNRLYHEMQNTLDVYKELENTSNAFEFGIKQSDKGGWFDESVETNLTDYSNALKEFNDAVTEYSSNYGDGIKKAIEDAEKASPAFAQATKDMTSYVDKLREFWSNPDAYSEGAPFVNTMFQGGDADDAQNVIEKFFGTKKHQEEALNDLNRFMNGVEERLSEKGYDFTKGLSKTQTDNLMKQTLEWLDKHPEWSNIRSLIEEKIETRWPIKLAPETTDIPNALNDWQQQMQNWLEAHGKPFEIKPGMRREDIVKMIHDSMKDAQTVIDQSSPLLLRFGVDLQNIPDSDNLPAGLQTPWGKKSAADNKNASAKYQSLADFLKEFGLPEPKDKNKRKGRSEDKELKNARTRLEEVKSFLSEYKKYREVYGKERAINILEKLFPTTKGKGEEIVDNYKNILNKIKGSIKMTTDDRKKFGISIDKLIADTNLAEAKEGIDRQMKQMEDYIADNASRFDLYNTLFEQTGSKDFSSRAFVSGKIWDDATLGMADTLREKMGEKAGLIDWDADKRSAEDWFKENFKNGEELYKLWEKIVDLTSGKYDESLKSAADAIKTTMTYEERIASIRAKYADKNKNAQTKREVYANNDKEKEEIDKVRIDRLKDEINWEVIFSDMSRNSVKHLEAVRVKLRAALKDGDIDPKNAKVITDKLVEIENVIAGKTNIMATILPGLRERLKLTEQTKIAEQEYKKAMEEERDAIIEYEKIKGDIKDKLNEANITDEFGQRITVELADISEENKEQLLSQLDPSGELYKQLLKLFQDLADSSANVQNKKQTTVTKKSAKDIQWDRLKKMNSFTDLLGPAAMGGNPLEYMQLAADNAKSLQEFIDKLDLGNTEFGKSVKEFANGVMGFNAALQSLAKGDIIGAVNGVLDGVGGIGKAVTTAIFGSGNVGEMEAEVARLADANKRLAETIESLADAIRDEDNTNSESLKAYQMAIDAEKEWEANQLNAIDARASESSNTGHGFLGLGGSSSFNYNLDHSGSGFLGKATGAAGFDWDSFNRVLEAHGYSERVYSSGDLWKLTPEMMKLLRDYAPKTWANLLHTDGESNPTSLIEEYIERAGKIEELTDLLGEKLTGHNWSSFKNSFVDMLKDLTSTSQDFADNLEEMISNAVLNSLVNEKYKDRIDKLYKMFADAGSEDSEGGTEITRGEADAIRAYRDQLSNDMIADRDAYLAAGVIKKQSDDDSSGLRSSIKGVTENTADLLAAYVNSIRADVSINRSMIAQYFPMYYATMTAGNQSLTNIEQHTAAIMRSNSAIQTSNQEIFDMVRGLKNGTWKMPVS